VGVSFREATVDRLFPSLAAASAQPVCAGAPAAHSGPLNWPATDGCYGSSRPAPDAFAGGDLCADRHGA